MLSDPIRDLISKVEAAEEAARAAAGGERLVEVNKVIARAATFYEKVRYLIDYREEHTIRRAALERILKRRVFIEQKQHSGAVLLQELVDGQYLQKDVATEALANDIDVITSKYLELRARAHANGQIARKLISFAATEIDAKLNPVPAVIDHESVQAFYNSMHGHVSGYALPDEYVNAQLYCACWRSLLGADNDRLAYALWLLYMPEWHDGADIDVMAGKLSAVIARIKSMADDELQWQIAQKIKNESIYLRIIREVIIEKGLGARHVLESTRELDAYTKTFLEHKYERENERIQSSGIRAVAYLFLTKMTVALAVEAPYEALVLGGINYFPLVVNILFHPTLLFALTRRVGSLDESNTTAITGGIHGILYEGKVRSIRFRNTYSQLSIAFGFMYLVLLLIVFGGVIGILELLGFNPVSIVLFLFFLALVSYFAFRIRYQARRWKVTEEQRALAIIGSVLAIPIIRTGRWLSQTFSSINIFVLIMDFIIETPFKRILNFSNQFLVYLREKAEEMR